MADTKITPFSVSSLTDRIKRSLESQFTKIYVEAEISGWRRHPSGHCYFTLKDSGAQISAVMFASAYERCRAKASLADGAKVLVYANVTVYPPQGKYQLVVLAAKPVGDGDLMQRYMELKAKLEGEGLFDKSRKRSLPFMPRHIAIVTSEAGAVIHDMCNVISRRFPNVEIRLYPAQVQGAEAPPAIIAGIDYFNNASILSGWTPDLLIIARGGGSFEDLFCFNDESLVRAVAASKIPVISAVGHETDFTLCDFAADVRAGTPSIAAEIAVPLQSEISSRLDAASHQMAAVLRSRGEWLAQRLDHIGDSLQAALQSAVSRAEIRLSKVEGRLAPALNSVSAKAEKRLSAAAGRLEPAFRMRMVRLESRLAKAGESLRLLSPFGVLDRGYSLTTDADGAIVRDASSLKKGDVLRTRFANGEAVSEVVSSNLPVANG
jgi:exodeoxyribonuclease VII large subunit